MNARLDSDNAYLANLSGGKTFMAAVSPWFFTHYGPDTWNKNVRSNPLCPGYISYFVNSGYTEATITSSYDAGNS